MPKGQVIEMRNRAHVQACGRRGAFMACAAVVLSVLLLAGVSALLPSRAFAGVSYTPVSISIPVEGTSSAQATAADGQVTTQANGALSFTYAEPGTYSYTVKASDQTDAGARELTVYVLNGDADLSLQATAVVMANGKKSDLDFSPSQGGSEQAGQSSNANGSGKAVGTGLPRTGDGDLPVDWLLVCLLSSAAIALIAIANRRRCRK